MKVRLRPHIEVPAYYRSPQTLLDELGISDPEDIIVEAIAQHCGATVLYETLHGSEARIIGYRDRAFITVDDTSPFSRKRFSVAHELGHWMWDRGKMAFSCGDNQFAGEWGEDNPERRANRYAVELLLPQTMFLEHLTGRPRNFETIRSLAETFETSLTATAIRFVELSPEPTVLVCSDPYRRRWQVRAASTSRALKTRDRLDPRVPAYSLLRGEIDPLGPVEVSPERWFEATAAMDAIVREDSIRIGSGLALSLLTWDPELLH